MLSVDLKCSSLRINNMLNEPLKDASVQTRIPAALRLIVQHLARKEHRPEAAEVRLLLIESVRRRRRDPFVRKHLAEIELDGQKQ